ncbi:HutD family protein [Arthrobacter sp. I2-34]|uniref:HutD family protein n=1 Tax=Arthrobacter hankyongi TaxID=2904801 RepID=A0ABS9LCS1_9MICC|nr:HutD family protein [Arthrobacter hankyongi]MCG2624461.1 HutD family protein [Arthrobacter hankyongi]
MPAKPVIRFADLSPSPWLNGAGRTVELASGRSGAAVRQPPGDGRWQWRLSLADVGRPAPFSRLPGIRRILTVVDGGPLDLTVDGVRHRIQRLQPFEFDGGAETVSDLPAGPVRNLNLMLRPASAQGSVAVIPVIERQPVQLHEFQLGVLLDGAATAAGQQLAQFDAVTGSPDGETITGRGQLALVSVF